MPATHNLGCTCLMAASACPACHAAQTWGAGPVHLRPQTPHKPSQWCRCARWQQCVDAATLRRRLHVHTLPALIGPCPCAARSPGIIRMMRSLGGGAPPRRREAAGSRPALALAARGARPRRQAPRTSRTRPVACLLPQRRRRRMTPSFRPSRSAALQQHYMPCMRRPHAHPTACCVHARTHAHPHPHPIHAGRGHRGRPGHVAVS